MKTAFNVIYRDLRVTSTYRNSIKRTRFQADRLAAALRARGWEVIIDEHSYVDAHFDAPIVDVKRILFTEKHCNERR